jgi:hypothetical protein
MHFLYAETEPGHWYWMLCDNQGQELYIPYETYATERACRAAINQIKGPVAMLVRKISLADFVAKTTDV